MKFKQVVVKKGHFGSRRCNIWLWPSCVEEIETSIAIHDLSQLLYPPGRRGGGGGGLNALNDSSSPMPHMQACLSSSGVPCGSSTTGQSTWYCLNYVWRSQACIIYFVWVQADGGKRCADGVHTQPIAYRGAVYLETMRTDAEIASALQVCFYHPCWRVYPVRLL